MSNVRLDLLRLNGLGQVAAEIEQLQDQNSSLLATNYDLRKERDRMTDELAGAQAENAKLRKWFLAATEPVKHGGSPMTLREIMDAEGER